MTRAALPLSIGLAGLLMSCVAVVSLRPLDEEGSCTKGLPIEGEWNVPDLNPHGEDEPVAFTFRITEQSGASDVEIREASENESNEREVFRLDACVVDLKGQLFFDANFREMLKGDTDKINFHDFPAAALPVHTLGKILFEPDMLVVQLLDFDWVRQNGSEALWEYLAPDKDTDIALFTGPSAELREFMARHAEAPAAFGPEFYLCRPSTDCVAAAYERMVRLALPTDATDAERLNLLEHLSDHYQRAGNSRRSLELLHSAIELRPQ